MPAGYCRIDRNAKSRRGAGEAGFCGAALLRRGSVLCKRLEESRCAAVMPLGAPYRFESGAGNQSHATGDYYPAVTVPVVVDAGIGVPSHATQALEMGICGTGQHRNCRGG